MNAVRSLLVLGACLLAAPALRAQTIVVPEKLDPARARMQAGALVMRDSLARVRGAISQLQRHTRTAPDPVLAADARRLASVCTNARAVLPAARDSAASGGFATAREKAAQARLVAAFDALRPALDQCTSGFAPTEPAADAKAVRHDGAARAEKLRLAVMAFEREVATAGRTLEFRRLTRRERRAGLQY